jgi:uncharacterized membrane protein
VSLTAGEWFVTKPNPTGGTKNIFPMKSSIAEKRIEKEYHVSWYIIAYKLLFGLGEFLLGALITFFGRSALLWYRIYAAQELSEDPHDLLVRLTEGVIPNVLAHHMFLALYLILLGGAKIAGAIGLMYKQKWGVDLLVGITVIMLPFQLIQLVHHPSFADFIYICIGLFIAMYLINFRLHEWATRMAKSVKR